MDVGGRQLVDQRVGDGLQAVTHVVVDDAQRIGEVDRAGEERHSAAGRDGLVLLGRCPVERSQQGIDEAVLRWSRGWSSGSMYCSRVVSQGPVPRRSGPAQSVWAAVVNDSIASGVVDVGRGIERREREVARAVLPHRDRHRGGHDGHAERRRDQLPEVGIAALGRSTGRRRRPCARSHRRSRRRSWRARRSRRRAPAASRCGCRRAATPSPDRPCRRRSHRREGPASRWRGRSAATPRRRRSVAPTAMPRLHHVASRQPQRIRNLDRHHLSP